MTSPAMTFAYEARTPQDSPLSGTIDAPDVEQARGQLSALGLRVEKIEAVRRPLRATPLKGADLIAFNQQLAQLTAAGLPVEHGLRLIAQDMRSGRLAGTIRQLADELDRGTPLGEAFEKFRGQFPPLYSRLIEAGVRTSNLPGMLLNLGRHLELINRLRGMLWQAAAYPIMVLVALCLVLLFLSLAVIPQFEEIFDDFGTRLPAITELLLSFPRWFPPFLLVLALVVVGAVVLWQVFRWMGWDRAWVDQLIVPLPLIGPIIRRNMIARWCDAVKLGVSAGLDLPQAVALAGEVVGSPSIIHDGQEMVAQMSQGQPLDRVQSLRLLPVTVPATMQLASSQHDLPTAMQTLSQMFQQQAETRLSLLPAIVAPILIIFIAVIIGFVIIGLFAPFISLIQAVSGPM